MTFRPSDANNITLDNVMRQWDLEHRDVMAPTTNIKDWPKSIEYLGNHTNPIGIRQQRCVRSIPHPQGDTSLNNRN